MSGVWRAAGKQDKGESVKHLRLITWPVWVALLFIAVTAISVFFTYRPFSTYWQAQDRYCVTAR